MATLAIGINARTLTDRMTTVMSRVVGVEVIVVGTDLRAISQLATSAQVDAFCFLPMSPAELLRTRRSLLASTTQSAPMRTALIVEKADSAIVYHALGYGIDDVVELAVDDDRLRDALTTLAEGSGRVCDSFVVPTVPLPHPVVIGRIDYADDVNRKIVTLISVGYTDREIADVLHFSHQVIRNRVSQLLLRSGLRNRTQLASRHTFEAIEGGARGEPFFAAWMP